MFICPEKKDQRFSQWFLFYKPIVYIHFLLILYTVQPLLIVSEKYLWTLCVFVKLSRKHSCWLLVLSLRTEDDFAVTALGIWNYSKSKWQRHCFLKYPKIISY